MQGRSPTEGWSSRLGVVLGVAASAVGLGNFLRFPGQVVENGGGAFMLPYFVALLLLGVPLGWVEWTIGRHGGARGFHSAPAIMGLIGGRPARYAGVLGVLIPISVYMYYVLIESWCLHYAYRYLTGDTGFGPGSHAEASKALFASVSGIAEGGLDSGEAFRRALFWAVACGLNVWFLRRGLSRGIELFCRWAMPAMALCALVVLVRVLTLGTPDAAFPERNVTAGLGFLWNPDLSKLADFKTWMAAAGQIFFSLSLGFGVIINYASYLRPKDDVALSSLTSSATNEVFEITFGGLITVTAAFVFLGASGAAGGTFGLGFQTLPVVFEHLPLGRMFGFLWFFMLFLAAVTSSLSMLQPAKAFIQEALEVPSERAVWLIALLATLGSSIVLFFSKGLVVLDTVDFWIGTFGIFVLATVQIICFGWVMGVDKGFDEAAVGAALKIPRIFRFIVKYVAPIYLLVVFVGFCVQNLPGYAAAFQDSPLAVLAGGLILLVLGLLLVATRIGEKRWTREQSGAAP